MSSKQFIFGLACLLVAVTAVSAFERCATEPGDRTDCGYPGIPKKTCLDRDCCFNNTIRKVIWCFFPLKEDEPILIPDEEPTTPQPDEPTPDEEPTAPPPGDDPCASMNPCGEHGECSSSGSDYTCKCDCGFDGENCENEKFVTYAVQVKTGKVAYSGTNAHVFITFIGDCAESAKVELNSETAENKGVDLFEVKSIDKFTVTIRDVGAIQSIKMEHDMTVNNNDQDPRWLLDSVAITGEDSLTCPFPCDCWLSNKANKPNEKLFTIIPSSCGG